jgi:hypothetical protein
MQELLDLQMTTVGLQVATLVMMTVAGPCLLLFGVHAAHVLRIEGQRFLGPLIVACCAFIPLFGISQLVFLPAHYSLVKYHVQAYNGFLVGLVFAVVMGITLFVIRSHGRQTR